MYVPSYSKLLPYLQIIDILYIENIIWNFIMKPISLVS